jgi:hypothetical protein
MTRWHDGGDPVAPPEAPDSCASGGIAGYDTWKTATPPEYEFLDEPPRPSRRTPVEPWMCGLRLYPQHAWLCTKPAGHTDGCDTFGEAR